MEFHLSYLKSLKMMLLNCCTQYISKFGRLSSGHRTAGQFSAGTGLKILYTVALPAISKTEGGIAALTQRVGQYEWTIYPFAERGELADSNVYKLSHSFSVSFYPECLTRL